MQKLVNSRLGAMAALIVFAQVLAIACSPAKWHETAKQAPNRLTGDPVAEARKQPTRPGDLRRGQVVTVATDRLCGRRIPSDKPCDENDTPLEERDKCVIEDATPRGRDNFVKCRPIETKHPEAKKEPVYVPAPYICPEPVGPSVNELHAHRYFIVQNLATQMLRVYERTAICRNELILETKMVIGTGAKNQRSRVGSYVITKWNKFFEDSDGKFPAWYSPDVPKLPDPGADLASWAAKSLLSRGQGVLRGGYGWYTAIIEPNASGQLLQGSIGWGDDSAQLLESLRRVSGNKDLNVAVNGSILIENRAIAMLREILVPGTKVVTIYAREGVRSQQSGRGGTWRYILTTENSADAPRSGRNSVENRRVSKNLFLEQGVYKFKASASAKNENAYKIDGSEFVGQFFVDEGRLVGYKHPRSLQVGGHSSGHLPSVVLSPCQGSAPNPRQPAPGPQSPPQPQQQPGGEEDPPLISRDPLEGERR